MVILSTVFCPAYADTFCTEKRHWNSIKHTQERVFQSKKNNVLSCTTVRNILIDLWIIIFNLVTHLLICENNSISTLKRCKVGRAASTSLVEAVDTGQCYHVDFGWFAQYRRWSAQFYGCFAHVRESYFARIICKPLQIPTEERPGWVAAVAVSV